MSSPLHSPYDLRKMKNRLTSRVSPRAIIIGLGFTVVQTAITPYNDYYIQGTEISGSHFPLGAAFVLIFLTFGINPFIKKAMPISGRLTPGELITIWIMLLVSSAIPSKGMMGLIGIE